jgi:N4-gp56 family major capsid protein
MGDTALLTTSAVAEKRYTADAFQQYLSQLVMAKYMGMDHQSVIHVKEDLVKGKGDQLTFNLISSLSGSGVTGDSTLEGNEESLNSYGRPVTVQQYRNAVREEGQLSSKRYPFDIADKFKPALLEWKAQFDEDRIFEALSSIDGVVYGAASSTQKNTWNVNNSDRILYGATTANYNATHATALSNVDATTDVLNTAHLGLIKRMAKMANPKIRPIRLGDGSGAEVYVYFAHPYSTRDLKADTAWQEAQKHAMPRGTDNPIFTGALGMYDGVIVVETDKILLLDNVGASTIDVAMNFLCGAQAVLLAQGGINGMQMKLTESEFDYENQLGCAIASIYGVAKARFETGAAGVSKDHGIVTSFVAGVAD